MTKTGEIYTVHYLRELEKLAGELRAYKSEADIWKLSGYIKNSGGNLALHLCGNLRHYFGHIFGGTDYVRKRDDEFALRNVPREKILSEISLAAADVKRGRL